MTLFMYFNSITLQLNHAHFTIISTNFCDEVTAYFFWLILLIQHILLWLTIAKQWNYSTAKNAIFSHSPPFSSIFFSFQRRLDC